MNDLIRTTISRWDGQNWVWGSTSCTATHDDPCRDHTGNYGEEVYDALDFNWDGNESDVIIKNVHYRMVLDK